MRGPKRRRRNVVGPPIGAHDGLVVADRKDDRKRADTELPHVAQRHRHGRIVVSFMMPPAYHAIVARAQVAWWRQDPNKPPCRAAAVASAMVESRMGAVAWGLWPTLRFPSPLIKPNVPISGIRLSDWFHREAHGESLRPQASSLRPVLSSFALRYSFL